MVKPKYKRVILKLSGEALGGEKGFGIDWQVVETICEEIEKVRELGVEVANCGRWWQLLQRKKC